MRTTFCFLCSAIILSAFSGKAESVTIDAPVTANLTFFLTSKKHSGFPASRFESDEPILRGIKTNPIDQSGTNIVWHKTLPFDQRYDFKLFDDRGKEVPRTEYGLANSRSPGQVKDATDVDRFKPLGIIGADLREMFRPDQMFVITNKGLYEMEVRIRICVPMTNGVPDTKAMGRLGYRPCWGIVVSPPVRVQVEKK